MHTTSATFSSIFATLLSWEVTTLGLNLKQINDWFINQRKRHWGLRQGSRSAAALSVKHPR